MKSLGDSYGDGVARYFGLGSKYGNHLSEYKNMTTHNYIRFDADCVILES